MRGKGAHEPTGEIPPHLPLPSIHPPLRKLFPGSDQEELTYGNRGRGGKWHT